MSENLKKIDLNLAGKLMGKEAHILTVSDISPQKYVMDPDACYFWITYIMDDEFVFRDVNGFRKAGDNEYECMRFSNFYGIFRHFLDVDESSADENIRFTFEDMKNIFLGKSVWARAQISELWGNTHTKIIILCIKD